MKPLRRINQEMQEIEEMIRLIKTAQFTSKINAYIEATKSKEKVFSTYMVYKKVIEYLQRISKEILLKYSDETFMRILKILIGEPNDTTEEIYRELVYRRFILKGNPLTTTADYYDFIYQNMNL
jgi:hypothetical protein